MRKLLIPVILFAMMLTMAIPQTSRAATDPELGGLLGAKSGIQTEIKRIKEEIQVFSSTGCNQYDDTPCGMAAFYLTKALLKAEASLKTINAQIAARTKEIVAEKAAAEKLAADKLAADKLAAAKLAAEKAAAEKLVADKLAAEKAKLAAEKAAAEKLVADKLAAEKAVADAAAAAAAAAEKAETDRVNGIMSESEATIAAIKACQINTTYNCCLKYSTISGCTAILEEYALQGGDGGTYEVSEAGEVYDDIARTSRKEYEDLTDAEKTQITEWKAAAEQARLDRLAEYKQEISDHEVEAFTKTASDYTGTSAEIRRKMTGDNYKWMIIENGKIADKAQAEERANLIRATRSIRY